MYYYDSNDSSIAVIKEFLHTFNLPTLKVLVNKCRVVLGGLYIKGNHIYQCCDIGDGIYYDRGVQPFTTSNSTNDPVFIDMLNTFTYNRALPNITKTLEDVTPVWNYHTQQYLGEYLRFYRDYKGVDLMPLYNCFTGDNLKYNTLEFNHYNHTIIYDSEGSLSTTSSVKSLQFFNWKDKSYKVYVASIRPFNDYTIVINCDTNAEICSGYYRNNQILYNEADGYNFDATYRKYSCCSNSTKIIYDGVNNSNFEVMFDKTSSIRNKLISNEADLCMFIKVPITCSSSLTVLEGDYSKYNENAFVDENTWEIGNKLAFNNRQSTAWWSYLDRKGEKRDADWLVTKLSLITGCSNSHHPFADRLVEYLYENAINPTDFIGENISRTQKALLNRDQPLSRLKTIKYDGVWDTTIRNTLYDAAVMSGIIDNKFDVLGYVDKDLEKEIVLKDGI